MSETSFKQVIQGLEKPNTEPLQGIVISADPLKIQVVNDEKLILGAGILYVPRYLTDHEIKVSADWETENQGGGSGEATYAEHRHEIKLRKKKMIVHNALKIGDRVHILSLYHGKQYYILDRVEA